MIALIATIVETLLPIDIIGAAILALFIGIILHPVINNKPNVQKGLSFTSKKSAKVCDYLDGKYA